MANTAFDHAPTITVPSPTVNNRVVTWNGTTGKVFHNAATVTIAAGVVDGVTALTVDNLTIDGNTITSTDTNGNITLTPNGSGSVVFDTTGISVMSFNGVLLDIKNDDSAASEIRLYCDNANAHYQAIRAGQHSGATNYTMILPHVPPTATQVLTTASISSNVAVLDWADAAAGGTTVNGDTDNGIISWITSSNEFQVEPNITFTGSTLTIAGDSSGYYLVGGSVRCPDSTILDIYAGTTHQIRMNTGDTPDSVTIQVADLKVAAGNVVIGTAGKGIDFSATSNASGTGVTMSNELLDDYEEGTFTPRVEDVSGNTNGSITYANNGGLYTKIGRLVHIVMVMVVTDIPSSGTCSLADTDGFFVGGLPFTINDTVGREPTFNVAGDAWNTSINYRATTGFGTVDRTRISLSINDTNGYRPFKHAEVTATATIRLSGTYMV